MRDGGWSGGARAGGSACESSAWLSETGVVCRGSVGRGGSVGAVVTVGAAGGKRDATQVCAGDLGDAYADELLRQVRKKLRRDHGFPRGEQNGKMHWGVRCVWSSEAPVFPWADGTCAAKPEPGSNLAMDCASGFGAAVFVTGTFGLVAAQEVVRGIVARAS